MKKSIFLLLLAVSIGLAGCSGQDSSEESSSAPSSTVASSEPVSSEETSSEILSSVETSSEVLSSAETSSEAVSSVAVSSEPPSSKAVSSPPKATPKPQSSKPVESQPASSKETPSSKEEVSSQPQKPAEPSSGVSALEKAIFTLVNEERASLNLTKLSWNDTLYKSAKIRSDELAAGEKGAISHTRPDGTTWSTALTEAGYSKYYQYTNENIAYASNVISEVGDDNQIAAMLFDGWKNSPAHYEAIIRPATVEIAIAVTVSGNDVYAAQHFGQIK